MTTLDIENRVSQKAEDYRLLSTLFREPMVDLSVKVKLLSTRLASFDGSLTSICEEMNELFKDGSQSLEEYIIEYSRLFIGPFKLVAPPYSSIYLEDKWEVMSRSTQIVETFYQRAGLTLETKGSEPADHISTQLEFMYYLNFKWNETGDTAYLELQKEFLYKIMTHWIPKFNSAIQEGASLPFYRLLGTLTELFIRQDFESIK